MRDLSNSGHYYAQCLTNKSEMFSFVDDCGLCNISLKIGFYLMCVQ